MSGISDAEPSERTHINGWVSLREPGVSEVISSPGDKLMEQVLAAWHFTWRVAPWEFMCHVAQYFWFQLRNHIGLESWCPAQEERHFLLREGQKATSCTCPSPFPFSASETKEGVASQIFHFPILYRKDLSPGRREHQATTQNQCPIISGFQVQVDNFRGSTDVRRWGKMSSKKSLPSKTQVL